MPREARVKFLYEPLPKQEEFHAAHKKFKLYAGGWGAGKSLCGAAETIRLSMIYPKNYFMVARMTMPELRRTSMKEILEFKMEVNGEETEFINSPLIKRYDKNEKEIELVNGSVIFFTHLDDAGWKQRGVNLGGGWIDELTEIPEEAWLSLDSRLRRKGTCPKCARTTNKSDNTCRKCGIVTLKHRLFGTSNPEGHDWVWKHFIAQPTKDHFAVVAKTADNPYLPDGYEDGLRARMPKEWCDRYLDASFDSFSGLVYKDFQDKAPYVVEEFEIPIRWHRFISLDFGYRNPTAILWFAVSESGQVYIYDEFYGNELTVKELATIIDTKNGKQSIQLELIDPSCKNRTGAEGRSICDEFELHGHYFQGANNDVRAGINRVSEFIKDKRVHIFRNCVNLRREFQVYKWKDLRAGTEGVPEKPVKKDDHMMDSVRYGLVYVYETPALAKKETGWKKWLGISQEEEHWQAA